MENKGEEGERVRVGEIDRSGQRYFVKPAVIRWINESETIPQMEINSCDVAIMLCIYQCQACILLIKHRYGPFTYN